MSHGIREVNEMEDSLTKWVHNHDVEIIKTNEIKNMSLECATIKMIFSRQKNSAGRRRKQGM